ncbi:MAG: hypothetical protein CM15mP121_0770 [Bacteroidota bacterium]|nr:MAG: hypothetical protein CM15mP121_0770 [Bacteroidota bacterium]
MTGYGYTNCYVYYFKNIKTAINNFSKDKFKVHNQFLDYLLKFGYFGVLLLIIFLLINFTLP